MEVKKMNYADIKTADVANGQGVRVSLFVSGCNHRCKGCFNAQAWDFNYGKEFTEGKIRLCSIEGGNAPGRPCETGTQEHCSQGTECHAQRTHLPERRRTCKRGTAHEGAHPHHKPQRLLR